MTWMCILAMAHERGVHVKASRQDARGRRRRTHRHHYGASREARGSGITPRTVPILGAACFVTVLEQIMPAYVSGRLAIG